VRLENSSSNPISSADRSSYGLQRAGGECDAHRGEGVCADGVQARTM